MLQDRKPKSYLGALSLLSLITVYMVVALPAQSHAGSPDPTKQELTLRELETKLEPYAGGPSENQPGPALTRFGTRRSQRSNGFGAKAFQLPRSKIPIEFEMLLDNDEVERPKRFDDYGHMRFGKRGGDEQFDDYGHMRFGR